VNRGISRLTVLDVSQPIPCECQVARTGRGTHPVGPKVKIARGPGWIVGNAEVTSINVFLADDAPLGDAEPLASAITGVMETHLLTNNLIFFTPAERDLLQGLRTECKPGRFDAVPPKGVFEIPECPGAMDGVQNIVANTVGLHRA
jgi:hypothetical protein